MSKDRCTLNLDQKEKLTMRQVFALLLFLSLFVFPSPTHAIAVPCPLGSIIEVLVYLDQDLDGSFTKADAPRDRWRVLLYNQNWELVASAFTGGGDGVYESGDDWGHVAFMGLQPHPYHVCAEFPRDWIHLTEPVVGGKVLGTEVVENPSPFPDTNPPLGGRNWDETPLCYRIAAQGSCSTTEVRFGILTYDIARPEH